MGSGVVVAWLLTEEGLVNGVFGDRVAGPGDSIWTVPASLLATFSVKDETVAIKSGGALHVYNTRTGKKTLERATAALDSGKYRYLGDVPNARTHLDDGSTGDTPPRDDWNPIRNMTKGWVKDRGGRHLLWLPVEWRVYDRMEWFSGIKVVLLSNSFSEVFTVIKLY